MKIPFDLQSAGAIHRIIQDAAGAVDRARKDDPTALQEISDSTDGDPFRVLIATVLSHRTKDPVTALASSRLFARFPNVKSLAAANTRTVARLIKPVGLYNPIGPHCADCPLNNRCKYYKTDYLPRLKKKQRQN